MLKLKKLINERLIGQYKDDHESFVTECKLLKNDFKKNKMKRLNNEMIDLSIS
jgi:hypothetical protein